MYHFAMFSDIVSHSSEEEMAEVEAFCKETGNDWADTFYNKETWKKFEAWKTRKNAKRPRVIVEVEGGIVQAVFCDCDIDVDILDWDNYAETEEGSKEEACYHDLQKEISALHKVF